MRFRNAKGKFKIYAVAGTNTVAFAIDCNEDEMKGLLGFAIEKEYNDVTGKPIRKTVEGFKFFKEKVAEPKPDGLYSTFEHPIQAFIWEDFTCYPGNKYIYYFTPLYGTPSKIKKGNSYLIKVETEPAWKKNNHGVFFNRGTTASQAYAIKFGNKSPEKVPDGAAYKWLSRGLQESILEFIGKAEDKDEIYGCFYEFREKSVLNAFLEAANKGVKINIIYDAKDNGRTDKETGEKIDSFPKIENEKAILLAGLKNHDNVKLYPRQQNKSYISHNKFMIISKKGKPEYLWTGSTNISMGGIFGQANVGHFVDDKKTAGIFYEYWKKLTNDPETKDLKEFLGNLVPKIKSLNDIPEGVTCVFSPMKELDYLKFYASLLDGPEGCGCITLAFGVHEFFQKALSDNDTSSPLTFMLLEKNEQDISDYVYKNHIVKAVGSALSNNKLFGWVKETNTLALKINKNVMYVHTKFLLKDPLGKKPVVVTGSANFSDAATKQNDENMLIIKGNRRVADIYFTEFLRIFNHYYFRWIMRNVSKRDASDVDSPAFLKPDDTWTEQYKKGKYKRARIEIFTNMYI